MNVICVIGDLIDSRKAKDRGALQVRFQKALQEINRTHTDQLASPCTITLGDEYQAVYRHGGTLFLDFLTILTQLHPARIRFSVGIGPLDTPINLKQALGMDGPAFHMARAGLDPDFKKSDRLFRISHAGKEVPAWIEPGLALVSHEVGSWKPNRFRVFKDHLAGHPPKDTAKRLHISPTAVYKNLQAGALVPIGGLLDEVTAWINGEVQP